VSKLVSTEKQRKHTTMKHKNEQEPSEWCKQAEQCSETNKNVVQLRMIMYNEHTQLTNINYN